jgi:NAD(P)H-nitrite reductase large subunit
MSSQKFVIIGDGNAGATAAETLREEDEGADITVLTDESEPLYNRIMLKNYMKGTLPKQYTQVHDEDWYESRDIKLKLETKAIDVDTDKKSVETGDGEDIQYDRLLVATGGSPRKLPQDEGYDNLHYMWTMQDAETIKNSAEEAEKAVVVGGGLLGIDLAVAYAENDCETYYLVRERNWWSRGLDEEGAEIIHQKMEEKGVDIITETEVEELKAEDSRVEKVVSKGGEEFGCDAVAVAIGQVPNSGFVDVDKNESGMIEANKFLETSAEDVFAAGNMVEYHSPVFERRTFNGSWDHSEAMGENAAKNMLGREQAFNFFNTYGVGHFDVQFLAIGDWSGEPVSKKYSEDEYRRLFFNGDRLVGAVMIGYTGGQEDLKQMIEEKEEVGDRESLLEK